MSPRDRKLLRELSSGQKRAYVEAVDQHYQRIYAFLYRMSQDATLAEDLTQDTFAAAWRSLDRFEGRSSFSTWLHKIALNVYREHRRGEHPVSGLAEEEAVAVPDPVPELIERLGAEELREKIGQAVALLPEVYREVVVLRCYQELKYREIADLLGVPMGTMQARLHVAFGKLRAALREEVEDIEAVVVPHAPNT